MVGVSARSHGRRRTWSRVCLTALAFLIMLGFTMVLARGMGRANKLVASPLLGRPAPSFDLERFDGGRLTNADLAGRIYVVNFWASWCVPCREEAPVLEEFAARNGDRRVAVVGVLFQDEPGPAKAFVEEFGLTYPQLNDSGRTAVDFGVRGVPETFIVNEDGIIMAALIGALSPGTLEQVIEAVRNGQTVTTTNSRYRSR